MVVNAGGRRILPRRTSFPNLKLILVGFVVVSFCGSTAGDEEVLAVSHAYVRQQNTIGLLAGDYTSSGFIQGKRDVGTPAPLARKPGGDTAGSRATTVDRHFEDVDINQGINGLPLVTDSSGRKDLQAATVRRLDGKSLNITKNTLKKIEVVIVLQDEGIIYCPIPKVSSSEWKRALRWMMGDKNWDNRDGTLHKKSKNGLELLADRGLKETRWAFESDRFTRFVVVRDPAERLVSAFMNKCARDGYDSGNVTRRGAPNCDYLDIMPELFPHTRRASLVSHARFKEAEALAGRLPAALPDSGGGVELDVTGAGGMEGMTASNRKTGVNETRRKEIHAFLGERFTEYHQNAFVMNGTTRAGDKKSDFLSERVMEIIHKMYEKDYDLLGNYF